jgi:ribosomal protein S27E
MSMTNSLMGLDLATIGSERAVLTLIQEGKLKASWSSRMRWVICPKCGSNEGRVPIWSTPQVKMTCTRCGSDEHMIVAPDDGSIPVVDERPYP